MLRTFVTSRSASKEILKEVLQVEGKFLMKCIGNANYLENT